MDLSQIESFLEIYNILQALRGIPGLETSPTDTALLYYLAKEGPGQGAIAEIGSFLGKSTIALAKGSKRKGREKVYAIDHHKGSKELQNNIAYQANGSTLELFLANIKNAGVEDYVVPVVKTSAQAIKEWNGTPLRLLFIDGSHEYADVLDDLNWWYPLVISGGIIALHDVGNFYGPSRVFNEKLGDKVLFEEPIRIMNLGFAVKI